MTDTCRWHEIYHQAPLEDLELSYLSRPACGEAGFHRPENSALLLPRAKSSRFSVLTGKRCGWAHILLSLYCAFWGRVGTKLTLWIGTEGLWGAQQLWHFIFRVGCEDEAEYFWLSVLFKRTLFFSCSPYRGALLWGSDCFVMVTSGSFSISVILLACCCCAFLAKLCYMDGRTNFTRLYAATVCR